ncbi:MAG: hypothetical protein K2X27_11915 [Candidatus Obscuribacterales bacterium]|nr:hypothetical protein [Candidatus Obscuribacterales bacterium]
MAYIESLHRQGMELLEQKEYDRAIAMFSKALSIDDKYFDALLGRSIASKGKGSFENALRDLSRAIALEPGNSECYYLRCQVFDEMGNRELADQDLCEAKALSPERLDIAKYREEKEEKAQTPIPFRLSLQSSVETAEKTCDEKEQRLSLVTTEETEE